MEPRHGSVRYLLAGRFYRMAWVEWGDPAAPPVICLHGLTRNGRDFDALAQALAADFRVICPDLPGRGSSDWLADPMLYQPASYVAPLTHLLATLDGPVGWVGTSLGGIVGMLIAACEGQPIGRLVLNDIGSFIPRAALGRIRDYMGKSLDFPDLAALTHHLRVIHYPFGDLSAAQWDHLARHSARTLPGGRIGMHYDPGIAAPIVAAEPADADLTAVWRRITVPRLVIRGESSDILPEEVFARMQAEGADGHTVLNAGHAPALMDAESIEVVRTFLRKEALLF
jgi:pimeloyl-ACP methyl ester carboxylesterase